MADEVKAVQLRDMLIQKVEEKVQELSAMDDSFPMRLKLQEAAQQFRVTFFKATPPVSHK
jgi:hypothetical protein